MRKEVLKYGIRFGVLTGIACFLFFLAFYALLPKPLMYIRQSIGINIILIWAGIWYFKRNNGGILHFYQGFSIGFLINIIGALIAGILIFLFIQYVDYEPYKQWILDSKSMLMRDKESLIKIMNEANFERNLASLDNGKPYQIVFDELMFKQLAIIPIGLLSMVMRKIQ